jgi:hypothetical protein
MLFAALLCGGKIEVIHGFRLVRANAWLHGYWKERESDSGINGRKYATYGPVVIFSEFVTAF